MIEQSLALQTETTEPEARTGAFLEIGCIETARELQLVLEEETEKLKRFAGAELIAVISRKEFLVGELSRKLEEMRSASIFPRDISDSLKAALQKIENQNNSNRYFIQNSLSHWQDLLSILYPSGYGPAREGAARNARPHKGLAFSREI